MPWPWSAFTAELSLVLDDAGPSPIYDNAIRLQGLNAALAALVPYAPQQLEVSLTAPTTWTLPENLYMLRAVRADEGNGFQRFLPEMPVRAGEVWAANGLDGYWIWGNTLRFLRQYAAVLIIYYAYYDTVTTSTADIPVPRWAREAVLYWTAAYCLNPNIVTRGRLGMWHDRRDAPPLDNSAIQAANFFRSEFERIVKAHHGAVQRPFG